MADVLKQQGRPGGFAAGSEVDAIRSLNQRKQRSADAASEPVETPPVRRIVGADGNSDGGADGGAEGGAAAGGDGGAANGAVNGATGGVAEQPAFDPLSLPEGHFPVTRDQFRAVVGQMVAREMAGLRTSLAEAQQESERLRTEAERARDDAAETERQASERVTAMQRHNREFNAVLADLGMSPIGDLGGSNGVPLASAPILRGRGIGNARDVAREFRRLVRSSSEISVTNPNTDRIHTFLADQVVFRSFYREHRQLLRDGVEQLMCEMGYLRGMNVGRDSPTGVGDLAPFILQYLSLFVRETHSRRFILWQFSVTKTQLGMAPGQTVVVPRWLYGDSGATDDDYDLTPVERITEANQPVQARSVSVQIRELGLGKHDRLRPIAFSTFVSSNSLADVERVVRKNLAHSYNEWQDLALRRIYFSTTRVFYNHANSVVETPIEVVAGSGGLMTYLFLNDLYAVLDGLTVLPFDDGCYVLVLCPRAFGQLKASLTPNYQFATRLERDELTNVVKNSTGREDPDLATSYRFTVGDFHVYTTNAISTGEPGNPGVHAENLGAGQRTTRTSFAIGAATTAHAETMPVSIVQDDYTNFGRLKRYTWLHHGGIAALDVDPERNPTPTDEQLRVFQIRTLDVPA